jgi:hypothetical protein
LVKTPLLGAGNGGLLTEDVLAMADEADLPDNVYLVRLM